MTRFPYPDEIIGSMGRDKGEGRGKGRRSNVVTLCLNMNIFSWHKGYHSKGIKEVSWFKPVFFCAWHAYKHTLTRQCTCKVSPCPDIDIYILHIVCNIHTNSCDNKLIISNHLVYLMSRSGNYW